MVRLELQFGVVRQRHEAALAALFGEMLELGADAGLVGVAVLATDGTKVHANASQHQNLDYDEIAREISLRPTRSTVPTGSVLASGVVMSCPGSVDGAGPARLAARREAPPG